MKKLFYSLFALAMTAMTMTSCEDVPAPYNDPNSNKTDSIKTDTVAATGTGTEADPYNVAAANKYIKNGGSETAIVYVKGKIVSVGELSTSYGNATYYISDDGTAQNQLTVYRGYSLGNKKFTSDTEIQSGDEVIVCGKLVNYSGTYEFTQGNYIYSLNGKTSGGSTSEGTGEGTQASPYNVAKALSIINAKTYTSDKVYLSGTISKIDKVDTSYGNATYYISDDGTTTTQLEVYRGYSLGGNKFTSESEIKVGDKVVIYGVLTLYNTTPEVTTGSQIYSLNGSTSGGGETTTGDATITKADNVITMVNSKATASENKITCDLNNSGFTDKGDPTLVTLTDGTTISFAQETGSNSPKYYAASKGVRMYALNSMTVTGSKAIAKMVITCDVYNGTNEVGNDQLYTKITGNVWKMVNDWTGTSGGTQVRVQTVEITYAK